MGVCVGGAFEVQRNTLHKSEFSTRVWLGLASFADSKHANRLEQVAAQRKFYAGRKAAKRVVQLCGKIEWKPVSSTVSERASFRLRILTPLRKLGH